MKCPNCGSEASGAFCAECGAPVKGAKCKQCNAALAPGANFCTNCGAAVHARAARTGSSNAAWYVVGAALVLLIGVLLWPTISGRGRGNDDEGKVPLSQVQGAGSVDAAASPAAEGPLAGTPREQADRLFNRIMTERENGDTARAKFFLPMGIQAYQMAGDLDADGLYHLSLLQAFGGEYKAALQTAEQILAKDPNHLLGLSAAAAAARGTGDAVATRQYARRFLAAFDTESKADKEEYRDHARMLPELKAEAQTLAK